MVIIQRLIKHNTSPRVHDINCLVIHKTAVKMMEGSKDAENTLGWFASEKSGASAHYVIDNDGTIYLCVPDFMVAWHAGKSVIHGIPEVNQFSLGIELVGLDKEEMPDAQMEALLELCAEKCYEHKIPLNRVVGHSHIAIPPGRKSDPGVLFDWFNFLNTLGAKISEKEIIGG